VFDAVGEAEEGAGRAVDGFALAAAEFEALEVVADGGVGLIVGVGFEGGDGGGDGLVDGRGSEEAVASEDGGLEVVDGRGPGLGPEGEFVGREIGLVGGLEVGEVRVEVGFEDGVVGVGRALGRVLAGRAAGVEMDLFADHGGMIGSGGGGSSGEGGEGHDFAHRSGPVGRRGPRLCARGGLDLGGEVSQRPLRARRSARPGAGW
jgi:hypothetical protein